MKPPRCPCCQSDDLAEGYLQSYGGVVFTMSRWRFKAVLVRAATCLACGAVVPYVDAVALAQVRERSREKKPAKAAPNEL